VKQGTGSISIIDSTFTNVPIGILTSQRKDDPPNIVIDNLQLDNVGAAVLSEQGNIMLQGGSKVIPLWAAGRRYKAGKGSYEVGMVDGAPAKPPGLLSGGKLFVKSRPQYENLGVGSFLVATQAPYNLNNLGTGDQTAGLNRFLADAASSGKIAFFPAGIYLAQGTVKVPPGSRLQGSSWSQIMCTGSYFNDMNNPNVFIHVGEKGQGGSVEIVEMIFSAKGPTAGAIMVEWNINSSGPGAAGMWDSHIRIGGAKGSDLDMGACPKGSTNYQACACGSLLLHITPEASGYFENVWAWVADHDNDRPIYKLKDTSSTQISLFSARGILIESQNPTWLYGTGSEHAVLYQYQLHKAKNVYMGHIQTEAPYFQPRPAAPLPFGTSVGKFPADPTFEDCTTAGCKVAWGLRVIDSSDVYFHTLGLYSWFNDYKQYCVDRENCQQKILQIIGSDKVAMYNIFTKASVEVASGGPGNTIYRNDSNQSGYTSQVNVWFPGPGEEEKEDTVYLGTEIYTKPSATCEAPCVFVLPPSPLASNTTIRIPPYKTSLEVGHSEGTRFVVTTTTITIRVPDITTDKIPMSNVNITKGITAGAPFYADPSVDIPPVPIRVTGVEGGTTTRMVTLPPWPMVTAQPGSSASGNSSTGSTIPVAIHPTPTAVASVLSDDLQGPPTSLVLPCPQGNLLTVTELDATITLGDCHGSVTFWKACAPTTTRGMDAAPSVTLNIECAMYTGTRYVGVLPWPTGEVIPIPTPPPQDEDEDNDEDPWIPCDAWFFSVCGPASSRPPLQPE